MTSASPAASLALVAVVAHKAEADLVVGLSLTPGHLMGDREGLLAAICADIHNDDRRLVYADYLEENGDEETAEYIRLSIAESRLPPYGSDGFDRERFNNQLRLSDIRFACYNRWVRPIQDIAGLISVGAVIRMKYGHPASVAAPDHTAPQEYICVSFRRGLPAVVKLPPQHWLAHGPELIKVAPLEVISLLRKEPVGRRWHLAGTDGPEAFQLPVELFSILPFKGKNRPLLVCNYATSSDAADALSKACLTYAHRKLKRRKARKKQ